MKCIWNGFRYSVCEKGIVYSGDSYKVMKPYIGASGYRRVNLSKNGKAQKYLIHRLIAKVFIPNPESLPCVNHKDGDKSNNTVSNLEWCTYSENQKHAYSTGLISAKGSKNGGSKLTEDDIPEIRLLLEEGLTYSNIGEIYNVKKETIRAVYSGANWRHV